MERLELRITTLNTVQVLNRIVSERPLEARSILLLIYLDDLVT